jgi:hypothetical protein
MKVIDLLEKATTPKKPPMPKKRPPKTLWFQDYNLWVLDVKSRFPEAVAHNDNDDNEIIAVDKGGKKCYGRWNNKDQRGVTFDQSRTKEIVVKYNKQFSQRVVPVNKSRYKMIDIMK